MSENAESKKCLIANNGAGESWRGVVGLAELIRAYRPAKVRRRVAAGNPAAVCSIG